MPESNAVLVADALAVGPEVAAHPLATQAGLVMVQHLIAADEVWSKCTPLQRKLLAEWCEPVVAKLRESGGERVEIAADELPEVWHLAKNRTVDALERRGLVSDRGRLTAKAVHAYFWAVVFKARGATDG